MTAGVCGICGVMVQTEDLLLHLRVAHDLEEDIALWPDGKPVIVDHTLEPADFESVECERCDKGTYGPDSNGRYWRCSFCRGTGRVAA